MARIRASATTVEVALTAATVKTPLQLLAATNVRIAIKGFSVSFDGVAGDAQPVVVIVRRQTTAGSGGSSLTALPDIPITETIQTTALYNITTEPTGGDILRSYNIHPQTGAEFRFAFDEELIVPGAGRIGITCTAPAAVNVIASFMFEE